MEYLYAMAAMVGILAIHAMRRSLALLQIGDVGPSCR